MTLTKRAAHRVLVKIKGLASTNDNPKYITVFLFNLALKGIVDYELLTLIEKRSLNTILEGKSSTHFYDQRTKQIKRRNLKKSISAFSSKEVQDQ